MSDQGNSNQKPSPFTGGASVPLDLYVKSPQLPGDLTGCSLVLATFNRPARIVELLERLNDLPDRPAEVVVVDGSPGLEAARGVMTFGERAGLGFKLKFVRSPTGLTLQRNVGIDASTGDFIFFLDDDCMPEPGYFRAIRSVFDADCKGEVGAVCGTIVNEMDRPLSLRWRIRFALGIVPRIEPGQYYPTATSTPRSLASFFSGSKQVNVLPGCAMAYRREVFRKHRFSQFFSGYAQGEDLEMSLRVGKEYLLLWCGDAHVVHNHAEEGRPPAGQKGRMEVRNRYFIWKRHSPEVGVADKARFWLDIAFILALDIIAFITRPLFASHLAHAFGVSRGAIECLISPPYYEEPLAARQYSFDSSGQAISCRDVN